MTEVNNDCGWSAIEVVWESIFKRLVEILNRSKLKKTIHNEVAKAEGQTTPPTGQLESPAITSDHQQLHATSKRNGSGGGKGRSNHWATLSVSKILTSTRAHRGGFCFGLHLRDNCFGRRGITRSERP